MSETYWNGESCEARRLKAVVEEDERFPHYWARSLIGTVRAVVEVHYGQQIFYIDDEDGSGWGKVTEGHGLSSWSHRTLAVSIEGG